MASARRAGNTSLHRSITARDAPIFSVTHHRKPLGYSAISVTLVSYPAGNLRATEPIARLYCFITVDIAITAAILYSMEQREIL